MESLSLCNLEGLSDLGSRHGVDMRPTLLRILTDLYVQKLAHTFEEERQYTELALRLLQGVDVATRVAVASRLAHHLAPPLPVLLWLARDVPAVAAPLLSHPALQSAALGDEVSLPAAAVVEGGATDEAAPPFDRSQSIHPATAAQLNELFFAANAGERRLILLNLDVVAPLPAGRVAVSRDPSIGARLEAAVLARRHEEFAQDLARALQIPREQARRIVRDDLGEPLLIAGKALGVERDVLYRILMFVNSAIGHSVERMHALAALYDEMTPQAAEGMIAIWQALQTDERVEESFKPVCANEDRPSPARAAGVAQHSLEAALTRRRRHAS